MQQANTIYFVEVKYRSSDKWGSGIDYITPKKLQQMHFAAEFWISQHNSNASYELGGIEVVGEKLSVSGLLLV